MHSKTLIAFAAALALGGVSVATSAVAAPPGHSGHAAVAHGGHGFAAGGGAARVARSGGGSYGGRGYGRSYGGNYGGGPLYDSCDGYAYGPGYPYGGCPGVPLVGRVINGVLGGYGPY